MSTLPCFTLDPTVEMLRKSRTPYRARRRSDIIATLLLLLPTLIVMSACGLAQAQDLPPTWWNQFRGPTGSGIVAQSHDLPIRMSDSENIVWNVAVPGTGWSSPVVDDELIWLTTAISAGESERQLDLALVAFERDSGRQKFLTKLFGLAEPALIHSLNSYASPTPCLDKQHVYCHFGTYGTAAVRRSDGTVAWLNQEIKLQHSTGPGSSPILHGGSLIFHADGTDTQSIVALDCQTGSVKWRTDRSGEMSNVPEQKKSFCTPTIVVHDQQELLISPAANWLYVYNPNTGEERFKVPYGDTGYSVVPKPVALGTRVYFCTGFDRSRLLCVDVAPQFSADTEARIQWTVDQKMPTMPSPLLVDGSLYLFSDAGIVSCVNAENGDVIWSDRLGGKYAASPILADGRIYIGNQAGDLFVIRPGSELDVLAVNKLDSAIMASPIAIGNQMIIRTAERLYLFAKPREPALD